MHHALESLVGEQAPHPLGVADVAALEPEGLVVEGPGEIAELLLLRVVGVEGIEPHQLAALGQQPLHERRADEARRSGDEHLAGLGHREAP